jgi:hypothetical protein
MSMPYVLIADLFMRDVVAEMLSSIWMPLTLYLIVRVNQKSRIALVV